jgi:hypothetical protein
MLWKSKVLEDQTMLEPTAPTVNGIKTGYSVITTSRTLKTENHLMLKVVEIQKVKLYGLGNHIKVSTKNGRFFISKIRKKTRLNSTEDLQSTSHSSLSQDYG